MKSVIQLESYKVVEDNEVLEKGDFYKIKGNSKEAYVKIMGADWTSQFHPIKTIHYGKVRGSYYPDSVVVREESW